ncbi:MAG: imidazole glycerol phosphate synthase subunit HisH [Planctomycetota bacterium]
MLVIVDYGMGNLRSVLSKLQRLKVEAIVSADPTDVAVASHLVLPGVGAFDAGMRNLAERGLDEVLQQRVTEAGVPILGICLGFQLLTNHSEEGDVAGLGWIDAATKRFDPDLGIRVPHSGWNDVRFTAAGAGESSPMWDGIPDAERFYFTHSFYVECADASDVTATTHYGVDFVSGVQRNNVYGTQFHPEKSHRQGVQLLQNFTQCAAQPVI